MAPHVAQPDPAPTHSLLRPARLYTREEVLGRPCPVPAEAGVYAWYFDRPPGATPVDNTHSIEG
jgi:hypothetical protein